MAYQTRTTEEHAYQIIQKEIKEGKLKNALVFYGKEVYLINWALDQIIGAYVSQTTRELDFSVLDSTAVSLTDIINCCETLPMMSERKVVLLRDFLPLTGGRRKGFSEEDEKRLAEYVTDMPDTTLLIFTAETVDKRKKLCKNISQAGRLYDFCTLNEKQLRGFISKRLKAAEKTAKPSAISQFIAHTGYYDKDTDYTLYNLENDIKKALAYSAGPEMTLEELLGTVSGNIDTNVFAMMDAVSRNRKEEAFHMLHNILNSGENFYKLLALLCSQFELMLSVREMREDGLSQPSITKKLGVHEFRVKKAMQFAENYSVAHLRRVLKRIYEIDKNIKTGLLEQSLAMEMLIAEM